MHEIKAGTFYRNVHDIHDYNNTVAVPAGTLGVVTSVDAEGIHVNFGQHAYVYDDLIEFGECYEFVPNGAQEQAANFQTLMQEVQEMTAEHAELTLEASNTVQRLGIGGSIAKVDSEREVMLKDTDPEEVQNRVNEIRQRMNVKTAELQKKQQKLNAIMQQQEKTLRVLKQQFGHIADRMNEVVHTISVYLGSNEDIVLIAEGLPAEAEEKITVRQSTLYMDEESAVDTHFDGLDFNKIGLFDEWVTQPENLNRLFPEARGIVALKPRREDVKYSDDYMHNAAMNENNAATYFLIRNGERVYRIASELKVGDTLFPVADEFDNFFQDRWDSDKVLKPGSRGYIQAMEKANARSRHYMRVMLLIQGLLDRTPVFHPLPAPHINICDRRNYGDHLNFVRDAENLLPTLRPQFKKWQTELNEQLQPGHRVIGSWSRCFGDHRWEYDSVQTYPKYASSPDDNTIHVIQEIKDDHLKFLYERTDWSRSNRRASYSFPRSVSFYLAYDMVTIDDIDYYLNDRTSRHEYMYMLPTLAACKKAKQKEHREEKPFQLLLVAQLKEKFDLSQEDAENRGQSLVAWYKFKNKVHRALSDDDAKALRMILQECRKRLEQETALRKRQQELDAVLGKIRELVVEDYPDNELLLVGHARDNEYRALVAANEDNIWLHELTFKSNSRGGLSVWLDRRNEWTLYSKRFQAWTQLFAAERWQDWNVTAEMGQHLRDTELPEVIDQIIDQVPSVEPPNQGWSIRCDTEEKDENNLVDNMRNIGPLPLAIVAQWNTRKDRYDYYCFYLDKYGFLPRKPLTGGRVDTPELRRVRLKSWKRVHGRVVVEYIRHESFCQHDFRHDKPWSKALARRPSLRDVKPGDAPVKQKILKLWPENIAKTEALFQLFAERQKKWAWAEPLIQKYEAALEAHLTKLRDDKLYEDFQHEYGTDADEFWEAYWNDKTKYDRYVRTWELTHMLPYLIENGVEFDGMTLEQAVAKAAEFGYNRYQHQHNQKHDNFQNIPMDWVLKIPEEESQEEKESSEEDEDEQYEPSPEVQEAMENLLGGILKSMKAAFTSE